MDLNQDTGHAIAGWPHVVQSLQTILATRLATRVFRREFGSQVPAMIDAPMNDAGIMALYVAVAEALERWEPRFELTDVGFEPAATGVITMTLSGIYRPNAHLGDLSVVENETKTLRVTSERADVWRVEP